MPTREPSEAEIKNRLASIVDSSDDAIVSKDLNGIIQSWNAGAERIFGYAPHEVIGKHIGILIPAHLLPEEDVIISKIRRGDRVSHYETVRRRKDGTLIDVSLSVAAVRNGDGTIVGASKIARDITEEKLARRTMREMNALLEEQVKERTEDLERAIEDLESFNAAVSHDLRTPLRAILGFMKIVLEDNALPEAQRRRLQMVLDSAQEMTRTTEALLRLSRIHRGEIQRATVDVTALARQILARIQIHHPDRAYEFQVEEGLTTRADPAMAEIVFENLLSNASKFTAHRSPAQIRVGRGAEANSKRLFVADNGIGFSASDATNLFRPFQRLRPTDYEGIGIGLATVRRIIGAHGGQIVAEGRPGEGATIWLDFGNRQPGRDREERPNQILH